MQRTKWIERTFNFDFPVGMFPFILERLYGTPSRLREMTAGLTDEQVRWTPGEKWSIKEQIGHLSDLEYLHDARINDFLEGKEILRAADMTNAATRNAGHNEKSIESLIAHFSQLRTAYISRLEQLPEIIHFVKALHPRLKMPMRPVDMAYFTAEHDDHHLASIREILNSI